MSTTGTLIKVYKSTTRCHAATARTRDGSLIPIACHSRKCPFCMLGWAVPRILAINTLVDTFDLDIFFITLTFRDDVIDLFPRYDELDLLVGDTPDPVILAKRSRLIQEISKLFLKIKRYSDDHIYYFRAYEYGERSNRLHVHCIILAKPKNLGIPIYAYEPLLDYNGFLIPVPGSPLHYWSTEFGGVNAAIHDNGSSTFYLANYIGKEIYSRVSSDRFTSNLVKAFKTIYLSTIPTADIVEVMSMSKDEFEQIQVLRNELTSIIEKGGELNDNTGGHSNAGVPKDELIELIESNPRLKSGFSNFRIREIRF